MLLAHRSQSICVSGEDITEREADPTITDEIQSLTCILISAAGAPTFTLQFRDGETTTLPYYATVTAIEAALEATGKILSIGVTQTLAGFPGITATNGACDVAPGVVTTFAFATEHGDVPPVRVVMSGQDVTTLYWAAGQGWSDTQLLWAGGDPSTAPDYNVAYTYSKGVNGYDISGVRSLEVVKGTSTSTTCSSRGLCDTATGDCLCFTGYGSSNGELGLGTINDCGWRERWWPQGVVGAGGG